LNIGIIAEDNSDVAVVGEFTLALLRPHKVGFSRFVGDGCGKLRRKCAAWADNLVRKGCTWIVVVHDLDDYDECQLRAQLTVAVGSARPKGSVVLIPKREIESWLLYDANAIAAVFKNVQIPKLPVNPEALPDPKKHLGDLVWKTYRKTYLNTVHNVLIAREVRISKLSKSPSFSPHPKFAADLKRALGASSLRSNRRPRRKRQVK
jgi:hypothetical protein